MSALLVFGVTILILGAIGLGLLYFHFRRIFQEEKEYERGLKMVSLRIHLPPLSDDIETTGRDVRDVVEENISRAQVIYNILGSTYKKGLKNHIFGQRHFGFEIVGWQGFVYFYATVPVILIDIVKQAIISAYPTAQIEEVAEHNIFNPAGKINATVGGELALKKPYAYPIATYQDLKRDALQSILNALSVLDKEDGAAIQILMRPANPSWQKMASHVASQKRKGKDEDKGFDAVLSFLHQFLTAFVKPLEGGKGKDSGKDLSNLDQSVLDSIDSKTQHYGFEVLIRVVASSNISQRAQTILENIKSSFALFESQGKNGFSFTPAKDVDALVTAYIMRFFPKSVNKNILNSVELATLFHFPDQSNIPTSQLERQGSKQVDGPRNIPNDGLLLGYNLFRGVKKPIRIGLNDRQRHMYVVGQTGTGKSTFLENLALQDMLSGNGFAFVDPHGDTAERLLAMVPRERTENVIYFSPADMDYPMGLNLFEFQTPDQKDFLIQEALNMLYKLYDPQHQGIMGPRYEHLFRNAALTVMADPAGGTFIDIPKLFRDPRYVQQKLQYVTDQNVIEFWQKEMPQSQRSNEFGEVVSWFVSKFGAFLSNEMMRRIIGQPKSSFNLREVMDNKKILIVNLSRGRTGDLNAKLLGMVFVMKFQAAAMSRANIPEDQRVDFSLYVDEFQNFSTDSFATIMSEARKYHLNLIVANQFTTQLTDEIRDAVFGNIGTIVSFRIGQNDVDALSKYFQPPFTSDDLVRIPNYNTIIRTLINGIPTQPFSMATLPPLGTPNLRLAEALKQLSAAKYGRPKLIVEKEIDERLATKPLPPQPNLTGASPFEANANRWSSPNNAAMPGLNIPPTGFTTTPSTAPKSSFLDDWLTKKRSNELPASPPTSMSPSQVQSPTSSAPPPLAPHHNDQPSLGSTLSARPQPHQSPPQPQSHNQRPSFDSFRSTVPQHPVVASNPHSVHQRAASNQNISSNEIEKEEVDTIAHNVSKSLDTVISPKPEPVSKTDSDTPTKPKEVAPPPPPLAPQKHSESVTKQEQKDSIYIDQDGNLRQGESPEDAPTQSVE